MNEEMPACRSNYRATASAPPARFPHQQRSTTPTATEVRLQLSPIVPCRIIFTCNIRIPTPEEQPGACFYLCLTIFAAFMFLASLPQPSHQHLTRAGRRPACGFFISQPGVRAVLKHSPLAGVRLHTLEIFYSCVRFPKV